MGTANHQARLSALAAGDKLFKGEPCKAGHDA